MTWFEANLGLLTCLIMTAFVSGQTQLAEVAIPKAWPCSANQH